MGYLGWVMKFTSLAKFAGSMLHVVLTNRLVETNRVQGLRRIDWGLDTTATLHIRGMIEFTRHPILASPSPQKISAVLGGFPRILLGVGSHSDLMIVVKRSVA